MNTEDTPPAPVIEIHFCPACRWWLRAGWMAQEIFATFGACVSEVRLVSADSGHFSITVNGHLIWERKRDGGFPEAKVLKQRLQPYIDPARDLGHASS